MDQARCLAIGHRGSNHMGKVAMCIVACSKHARRQVLNDHPDDAGFVLRPDPQDIYSLTVLHGLEISRSCGYDVFGG